MILKAGDSSLKKVETEDNDIGSPAFHFDLDRLLCALQDLGGMGIAAPQLGIQRRLLLIESKPNERYPHAPKMDLLIMSNPRLIRQSAQEEYGWEGCLSVPAKRIEISRSLSVTVSYSDVENMRHELELTGFPARIFLHEFDHLEGLTILDRAESPERILSEEEYFSRILKVK